MRKAAINRINMIGQTYNSWKILSVNSEKSIGKVLYFNAECLECNKIFTVHGPNVRNGRSKRCTDCGHLHGHNKQKGTIRTGETLEQRAVKYLFRNLKKSAKKRGLEWTLTLEEVFKLVFDNCYNCGDAPNNTCNPMKHHDLSQESIDTGTITRHGIDRLNSAIGYTADNVVTCCTQCNTMKFDYTESEFLSQIAKIFKHRKLV